MIRVFTLDEIIVVSYLSAAGLLLSISKTWSHLSSRLRANPGLLPSRPNMYATATPNRYHPLDSCISGNLPTMAHFQRCTVAPARRRQP